MTLHMDSSALVKLVIEEKESDALRLFIRDREFASIAVARTELVRAVGRRAPRRIEDAEDVLTGVRVVSPGDEAV